MNTMNQKTTKKGSRVRKEAQPLTATEAEILGLFKAGRNAAQIAAKRSCSHSYVSRILKKLAEKGLVQPPVQGVGYTLEPYEPSTDKTSSNSSSLKKRVHAQRFTFNIVRTGKRFKSQFAQTLKDGTFVSVSGKRLYVMAGKGRVFSGASLDDALRASLDWWAVRFSRIESDLDCVFWKDRRVFEVSYTEVASEGSAVASEVFDRSGCVRVFSDEDGKFRLSFDMSTGVPEYEVHHAKSWRSDDEAASHHFNAILDYGVDGATLPELSRLHADLVGVMKSQVELLSSLLPKPRVSVVDDEFADYFG